MFSIEHELACFIDITRVDYVARFDIVVTKVTVKTLMKLNAFYRHYKD